MPKKKHTQQEEGNKGYFDPREIEIVQGVHGKKENRFNPRTLSNPGFGQEEMASLRKGITKDGLNHALLVWIDADTGRPKLVAGERRLRAIRQLIEEDVSALKEIEAGNKDAKRVMVKNQRTGKIEPALKVYGEDGVECKISDATNEREFLRQAIQENTLHESLTDFEILQQCKNMEEAGFSRSEQAETLEVSEAWISQSHSLINGPDCVLKAMERQQLTRTAALTFLPVDPDKVASVLRQAVELTYKEAEIKEAQAQGELNKAMDELQAGEAALSLSRFTGDHESEKKAKRQVSRAGKSKEKAEKKLAAAKNKKKKKITVDTIQKAAQKVDGAAENMSGPQSMKHVRQIIAEMKDLLIENKEKEELTNPANDNVYTTRDMRLVWNVLEWMSNRNHCKHPLDCIDLAEQPIPEEPADVTDQ
jgi:hypothetical protein